MKLYEHIGKPALLEQMAEECAELAQACLKASRVLREENPTPKTWEEAWENLQEEAADVMLCRIEMEAAKLLDDDEIEKWVCRKTKRMIDRFHQAL